MYANFYGRFMELMQAMVSDGVVEMAFCEPNNLICGMELGYGIVGSMKLTLLSLVYQFTRWLTSLNSAD